MKIYAVSDEAKSAFKHALDQQQGMKPDCGHCNTCREVGMLVRYMPDVFFNDCFIGMKAGMLQALTLQLNEDGKYLPAYTVWLRLGYQPRQHQRRPWLPLRHVGWHDVTSPPTLNTGDPRV